MELLLYLFIGMNMYRCVCQQVSALITVIGIEVFVKSNLMHVKWATFTCIIVLVYVAICFTIHILNYYPDTIIAYKIVRYCEILVANTKL